MTRHYGKSLQDLLQNGTEFSIWDVDDRWKQKSVIVVRSKERGARTRVTACAWSPDGKMIAGGELGKVLYSKDYALTEACLDGTLHVWKVGSNYARPDRSCETAHKKDTETTSVAFSRDGLRLATRGGDGTVKREFEVKSSTNQ